MRNVHLGVSCVIGENVTFEIPVYLGDGVRVGSGTVFSGTDARSLLNKRVTSTPKTVVEPGSIIGSNCTIVGNTIIQRNSIVADGSVVIGMVRSMSFVAGNPARHIYSLSTIKA